MTNQEATATIVDSTKEATGKYYYDEQLERHIIKTEAGSCFVVDPDTIRQSERTE